MGTAERRAELLRILCRRRHETVGNLAAEFGVSERTIQRDVEILSLTAPIYTQCGRYDGGIYVTEGYVHDRMYMTDGEIAVLQKLAGLAERQAACRLQAGELAVLERIIAQYTKPKKQERK